jgi:hypothetical protein
VLDDLGEPRSKLALGQRSRHGRVDDDEPRLVERADHVLAQRVIDRRLAADGRVDLSQDRGRELHEVDSAHVSRRREARDIADGAAAECEYGRGPVEPGRQELVPAVLRDRQRLRPLALRHFDRGDREAGRLEARHHRLAVEARDRAVADQRSATPDPQLAKARADGPERARGDDDAIGPVSEGDVDVHVDSSAPASEGWLPTWLGYQGFRLAGEVLSLRRISGRRRPSLSRTATADPIAIYFFWVSGA